MGLLRQETRLFAALWLGTLNDVVPEAADAREVSDRLFETADTAVLPNQPDIAFGETMTTHEWEAPMAAHSSWVH